MSTLRLLYRHSLRPFHARLASITLKLAPLEPVKFSPMALGTLPADFLSKPAENITKTYVDWQKTQLPEYEGLYAVVLDNVMTAEECDQLVKAAVVQSGGKWETALVNAGGNNQRLMTDVRNNDRIMWDDKEVVARLWKRVEAQLPELQEIKNQPRVTGNGPPRRGEIWEFSCLNERMRFLQYGPSTYFRAHCDGTFERSDFSERSMYTLHLYLNERSKSNPLLGGATSFHNFRYQEEKDHDVYPKIGRVLIFQHSGLLHSGQEVEKGLKLTMRTDLMFKKNPQLLPETERMKITLGKSPHYQYRAQR